MTKFLISSAIVAGMVFGMFAIINAAISRHVAKVESADAQMVKKSHDRLMEKFDRLVGLQGK